MADPTLLAAAITAVTAAAATATSEGLKQRGTNFLLGGTISNQSIVDFEISFFDEIRGSWGTTPTTELLGMETIFKTIEKAVPKDVTTESEIVEFAKEYIVSGAFEKSAAYFDGNQRGIGFKGCIYLRSDEKDISIVIYLGKVPNHDYKAGVWMGSGAIGNDYKVNGKKLGQNANKWENYLDSIEDDNLSYASFSTGGTKTSTFKNFEIKYNSAEKINFELKYTQEIDLLDLLNGKTIYELIRGQGQRAVYFIMDGTRRWVKDPETLFGLGYNWSSVKNVSNEVLESFPKGADLPSWKNGNIYKGSTNHVYLMQNGKRCWVTSPSVFSRMGLKRDDLQRISDKDLQLIPEGENLR